MNARDGSFDVSPKRRQDDIAGDRHRQFDYYAAFSHSFVEGVVKRFAPEGAVVCDPWNGRGTTTSVCSGLGVRSIGLDLNPAMVSAAYGRLTRRSLVQRALTRLTDPPAAGLENLQDDSLLTGWFSRDAAASLVTVRAALDRAARDVVTEAGSSDWEVYCLQGLLRYCLGSATRLFLAHAATSNPTWLPLKFASKNRLRPSSKRIWRATLEKIRSLQPMLDDRERRLSTLAVADSRALPLPDRTIDLFVSSPPYCTRIDYAVATSPELSLLPGMTQSTFRLLRESLIGTTTIASTTEELTFTHWGAGCADLLHSVATHASKASQSYYLKNLVQYFDGLNKSLFEITRSAKASANIILVVQDSYYKDIRIDLAHIVIEMLEILGWQLCEKQEFVQRATMAASHPHTRTYRSSFRAVESVLRFQRSPWE